MTIEETLNLPVGQELDRLVAKKVFGLNLCVHELAEKYDRCAKCDLDISYWNLTPPSAYSAYDWLAMEIPHKLVNFSFACWYAKFHGDWSDDSRWIVKFRRSNYPIDRHDDVDETYTGRGDTFALACCRAALAAVMAEFQV